uniref:NADH dehydrogenase subunit 6 n=1 Tax=Cepaea nemoralis TaxID=28835 RepID=Q34176_CEPNE|nr:NADH dehydrogenase subunit 6 [Cepaea nemoralis]
MSVYFLLASFSVAVCITIIFSTFIRSPLIMLCVFSFFALVCSVSSYVYFTDFFPYLLYLVYVGGLLVLMIYMVRYFNNFSFLQGMYFSPAEGLVATCLIFSVLINVYLYGYTFVSSKALYSGASCYYSGMWLILLVLLLLYVFLSVSFMLRLGGRTFSVGITSRY